MILGKEPILKESELARAEPLAAVLRPGLDVAGAATPPHSMRLASVTSALARS